MSIFTALRINSLSKVKKMRCAFGCEKEIKNGLVTTSGGLVEEGKKDDNDCPLRHIPPLNGSKTSGKVKIIPHPYAPH